MNSTRINSVKLLLLLTFVILVAFGIGSLLRRPGNPERANLYIFYAVLMFIDAALMLFCALRLDKGRNYIFYFTAGVLCLNIFPTIFDQFGLVDFLFLVLNLVILTILIARHKELLTA